MRKSIAATARRVSSIHGLDDRLVGVATDAHEATLRIKADVKLI
jgi:hypothetical protein